MSTFFFSSRRLHTRSLCDWSSDVCSSDLVTTALETVLIGRHPHLALWQWETAEDERLAREALARSEERRVGKECRSRRWRHHKRKNQKRDECSRTKC